MKGELWTSTWVQTSEFQVTTRSGDREAHSASPAGVKMASMNGEVWIRPFRLMTKSEAAYYCRRTVKSFELQCAVPPIIMPNGDLLWDVRDVDAWIDRLKTAPRDESEAALERLG